MKSSTHPSVGAARRPKLIEHLLRVFGRPIRLVGTYFSVVFTDKPSTVLVVLENRFPAPAEAIYARVDDWSGRVICVLATKHNAAANSGVFLPTFPIIKALGDLGKFCLKGQKRCIERRIVLTETRILRNQGRIRAFQEKHGSHPKEGCQQPSAELLKSSDQPGDQANSGQDCRAPSDGAAAPRKGCANQIHTSSPNVEKGCVRTPDSTLCGNHGVEGA